MESNKNGINFYKHYTRLQFGSDDGHSKLLLVKMSEIKYYLWREVDKLIIRSYAFKNSSETNFLPTSSCGPVVRFSILFVISCLLHCVQYNLEILINCWKPFLEFRFAQ